MAVEEARRAAGMSVAVGDGLWHGRESMTIRMHASRLLSSIVTRLIFFRIDLRAQYQQWPR